MPAITKHSFTRSSEEWFQPQLLQLLSYLTLVERTRVEKMIYDCQQLLLLCQGGRAVNSVR
jgi:hypothetical protein